jgi:hypothetical protein
MTPEPIRPQSPIVDWSRAGWAGLVAAPVALVVVALAAKAGLGGDAIYLAGAIAGGMAVGAVVRSRRG